MTMNVLAVVLADVVDRADVRVVQRRGDARFARGSGRAPRDRPRGRRQELQRDLPAEPDVLGAVDDAHAAAAQPLDDPIMANGCADHSGFRS